MSRKDTLLFHSTDKDQAVEQLTSSAEQLVAHRRAHEFAVRLEWDKFTREWCVWLMRRS